MEDKLKALMQELGEAINESLSDSERIAAVISKIRQAGYDVYLVLEATIGLDRREGASDEELEEIELELESEEVEEEPAVEPLLGADGKIKWTAQDKKFLKALKIAVEDD